MIPSTYMAGYPQAPEGYLFTMARWTHAHNVGAKQQMNTSSHAEAAEVPREDIQWESGCRA